MMYGDGPPRRQRRHPPSYGWPQPPGPGRRRGWRGTRVPPFAYPMPLLPRRRWWPRLLALALVAVVATPIAAVIYLDTSLHRIDVFGRDSRAAATAGTNWLLAGSDSRAGLTAQQQQQLATGDTDDAGGERSDTIILVHIPRSGRTTVVSLPRDSFVPIPGQGRDKLNAAFSAGGPPLLVRTVESATGLHIDHFAKVGFGGFAGLVDALGGVDMCLPEPMTDPLAGIDLPAGCQHLNGPQALGFVRSRATARADLDRMNDQRLFLSALLKKVTAVSTLANPLRVWPTAISAANALQVAAGDHAWDVARLGWALHDTSDVVATTVPIGGFSDVAGSGNVVQWDRERAKTFFDALANDRPLPADLITR